MRTMMVDGHPDSGRLTTAILDKCEAALSGTVDRVAVRDLDFKPPLTGYRLPQPWEPDLRRCAEMIEACDHLVIAFPMWWGAEPSPMKAWIDRVLIPGFAFNQHEDNPWWDRHLAGRSADVLVTMDTPAWYLRFAYGNSIIRRWKGQVLGYCGISPVRFHPLGPVRQGGAEKKFGRWVDRVEAAMRSAPRLKRGARTEQPARYLANLET